MATIKKREIAQLSVEQLNKKSDDLRRELMKLNMQRSTGTPPENPGLIRSLRKAIARVNTFKTQKKTAPTTEKKSSSQKKKTEVTKKTK